MDEAQLIGVALGLGVLAAILLIVFIKSNIVLCQPNELVVIAGRQRQLADGSSVGYRVIRGGHGFKRPLTESVARLSLNTIPIELALARVMCKGMIPVTVESRATVKLAGNDEGGMNEAIERFLGKGQDAVMKASTQALEGAIRGTIANMSPEEANTNRLELASRSAERARADLRRLGIVLDFLQIQEVTDDQGYLEAIGRKENATVRRDASIAEAIAEAEARKVAAEQRRLSREAEIGADLEIVEHENKLAVKQANLEAEVNKSQQRASVAGEIARVEEEVELETRRIQLREKHHEADTVVPARAKRVARLLEAEGEASSIRENGRATAEAVGLLKEQWQDEETRDLFLIQLLPELLDKVTSVVADNLRIDRMTILDSGNGEGLPTLVKNLTSSAVTMLEQVKNVTGIDLADIAHRNDKDRGTTVPKELD